jgi:hypothetical protein
VSKGDVLVGDDHHCLQPPQIAVGAPILGEFDRRAGQLAGILIELGFQPLEQRERVGRSAGEAADYLALAEPAHLLGVGLDDRLPDRDLTVAAHGYQAALAHGQDGRAVPLREWAGFRGTTWGGGTLVRSMI